MNCFIRITHDYEANAEQELSVLRGDIVQDTGIVDRHRYRGHCNGFDGTFPSSCGEEIKFNEPLADGQQVFAAFSDFPAIEKADLLKLFYTIILAVTTIARCLYCAQHITSLELKQFTAHCILIVSGVQAF
ncbi:dynamin-binding protein-like protein [Dinothrombium tinctorium]|uniref:Dynamin-binding protein-like protein n=1 Tax=Dinothrombium tinctorium TaxID=1965070 RepID=A0A443QCB7_9ACAR|nr:dynamin-binding protein-like protein [Dinothrombium tinctorium]